MTIEAQRQERELHDHAHRDRLIRLVTDAIGPPYDGASELANIAFARRLVAALIALHVVHARSTEQDQPKEEDTQRTEQAEALAHPPGSHSASPGKAATAPRRDDRRR